MNANRPARFAALLVAASLASVSAPAQQPAPTAPQPPAPSAAPGPRGHGAIPGRHFDRGPMPPGGPEMHHFGHSEMGGGFRIGPPGMWWKNPGLVQRIGLSAEQTKKMDDIFQQSRIQLVDLKANLEKQNLLLEPMLSANPVDQAKALAQIDKVAQARADLEKANAKMLLGIRAVLTPEQWTKLQSGGREMGSGREGGAGAPGGPSGPGAFTAPEPHGPGREPRSIIGSHDGSVGDM